ncbi:MAG: SGNH/GDSL hydrolase family protein [Prevotella sp.]|jgi:lysophospholipase L1-like esterase
MKQLFLGMLLLFSATVASAQNDWGNIGKYAAENRELASQPNDGRRVVFLGNSITELWKANHPDFFRDNHYICRGISGQTTYQYLVRFREDVINLKPKVVVINGGTNDIAENNYAYNEDVTYGNILTMVELARAHKIKVIMTSVLPSSKYGWRPNLPDVQGKISRLNARLEAYAKRNKIAYVDYYSALVSGPEKSLNPQYTKDGTHPTGKGYDIMEPLVQKAIRKYVK